MRLTECFGMRALSDVIRLYFFKTLNMNRFDRQTVSDQTLTQNSAQDSVLESSISDTLDRLKYIVSLIILAFVLAMFCVLEKTNN